MPVAVQAHGTSGSNAGKKVEVCPANRQRNGSNLQNFPQKAHTTSDLQLQITLIKRADPASNTTLVSAFVATS